MTEACQDCCWWAFNGGKCKRHAPVIKPDEMFHPKWPVTEFNDWCGDFEAKAEEVPKEISLSTRSGSVSPTTGPVSAFLAAVTGWIIARPAR